MEGGGTLLDILGTLIAFVTVILLLSLVVTALVQMVQAGLRMRGRNLQLGLVELFETANARGTYEFTKTDKDGKEYKETHDIGPETLAARVCSSDWVSPTPEPTEHTRTGWVGPKRSWIDSDALETMLQWPENGVPEDQAKKVTSLFPKLERTLSKRYQFRLRIVSVVCALVIAFAFQVSATGLLRELSMDPELRARYLSVTDDVLAQTESSLQSLQRYEDVSEQALEELQERHENLAIKLEEASGIGETKRDMIEELELVLADEPELRVGVLGEYEELLDEKYREVNEAAWQELEAAASQLALLDIQLWSRGTRFYRSSAGLEWDNIFGVLLTALLLTFGAPFWFKLLKNLAHLRDVLAPKEEDAKP